METKTTLFALALVIIIGLKKLIFAVLEERDKGHHYSIKGWLRRLAHMYGEVKAEPAGKNSNANEGQ